MHKCKCKHIRLWEFNREFSSLMEKGKYVGYNADWAAEKSCRATLWTSHTCLRKPMNQIAWHSCIIQILQHNFPIAKQRRGANELIDCVFMCLWASENFTGSLLYCLLCILQATSSQTVNYYEHVWLRARNEAHVFCYNHITQFSSFKMNVA